MAAGGKKEGHGGREVNMARGEEAQSVGRPPRTSVEAAGTCDHLCIRMNDHIKQKALQSASPSKRLLAADT